MLSKGYKKKHILRLSGQESKTVSPQLSPDTTDSLASDILSFKTGTILDELEIRVRKINLKHIKNTMHTSLRKGKDFCHLCPL